MAPVLGVFCARFPPREASDFVVASALRVLHPLPNATLHTHLIVVSVEFWPGLLPTAETPLCGFWFRFLGEDGIISSVRGLGHGVAGLYSASYTFTFTVGYFSAYVGGITNNTCCRRHQENAAVIAAY